MRAVIADAQTVAGWWKLARDLRSYAETLRPEGRLELIREAEAWERKAAAAETASEAPDAGSAPVGRKSEAG